MKKKMIAVLLTALMAVGCFTGCSSENKEDSSKSSQTETDDTKKGDSKSDSGKPKIGICMINYVNPFYTTYLDVAEEAAEEFGYEIIKNSAEDSLENEVAILENYIQQGVDAILFDAIDAKGVIDVAEKAAKAGIPTMSIFNPTEAEGIYNCAYEHKIGFKSVTMSIAEQLGGKGKICAIQGSVGNFASDQRTEGMEEALKDYPDIELVDVQACDWDPSKAVEIVQNWLTAYDDIDAVICMTDGATPSVSEVITASGKDILVGGNDGELEVLEMMNEGQVQADTLLGSKRGAWLSIMYMDQILKGNDVEDTIYIPSYLVSGQEVLDKMKADNVDLSWIPTATPDEAIALCDGYKEEFEDYFK